MRRVGSAGRAVVLAVAFAAGVAGCGDGGDARPTPDIDASTYVAAIEGFLPPSTESQDRPVVFVVPVGDQSLALDTQVAVIDDLAETHDLRFVDTAAAGVDADVADQPARDGGTLLGVGTVTEESPHTIRIEVYRDRDEVEGHLVTVALRGGRWTVVEDQPVEPEVLVGE